MEYRDGLEGCADNLLDLASLPHRDVVDPLLPEVSHVNGFTGLFAFLSNSARAPMEIDGVRYPTVEHAYSARKIVWESVAADVRFIPTPAGAIERREAPARANWINDREMVMAGLLATKFGGGSRAANQLLATGQATLRHENWWGDTFWGTVGGLGDNRLGSILEGVRGSLRANLDAGQT